MSTLWTDRSLGSLGRIIHSNAIVKYIIGESENCLENLFQCRSRGVSLYDWEVVLSILFVVSTADRSYRGHVGLVVGFGAAAHLLADSLLYTIIKRKFPFL